MNYAEGRDPAVAALVRTPPGSVRIALPSVCVMEAFSALNARERYYQRFAEDFRGRIINDCRRDVIDPDQPARLGLFERSRLEIEASSDQVRSRLSGALEFLAEFAESIATDGATLLAAIKDQVLVDPTDNLIFWTILRHSRTHPLQSRAFLTEDDHFHDNREVRDRLIAARIKRFKRAQPCLDWLKSLTRLAEES